MKKLENGLYEHNYGGKKFICDNRSTDNYIIKVFTTKYDKEEYKKIGEGTSLGSCKRRIKEACEWL